jgi:AbrB family looped-hinge helix DNA binding protein
MILARSTDVARSSPKEEAHVAQDNEGQFECCAFAKMNSQGQILIPKDVREDLGWGEGTRLMVFADPSQRCVMLTVKPLDAKLLDLAREAGTAAAAD